MEVGGKVGRSRKEGDLWEGGEVGIFELRRRVGWRRRETCGRERRFG